MKEIFVIRENWRNDEDKLYIMMEGSAFLSEAEAIAYCCKLNNETAKDDENLWYDYSKITLKTLDKLN